jgi:hypothetical protein
MPDNLPDVPPMSAVHDCITAIVRGPWIEEFEFHARIGVFRRELEQLLRNATNPLELRGELRGAVGNCINEVCNGIFISAGEWPKWFRISPTDMLQVLKQRNSSS